MHSTRQVVQPERPCALAAAARDGNGSARNALWERYAHVVAEVVRAQRSLPRLWDREDLRQEAFIVFAGVWSRWNGEEPDAWIEREMRRQLALHVRRAWRRQRREVPVPEGMEIGDAASDARIVLSELLAPLSKLPAQIELALRLHVVWGLPLSEVGRRLGLGRRALGGVIPAAREALAGKLESEEERAERLVRRLYSFADLHGRIRGEARQIQRALGLSGHEYRRFVETLVECGVLTGRSRGHAGRLPVNGPEAAVRLLRRVRRKSA